MAHARHTHTHAQTHAPALDGNRKGHQQEEGATGTPRTCAGQTLLGGPLRDATIRGDRHEAFAPALTLVHPLHLPHRVRVGAVDGVHYQLRGAV
jgi:hypothetical protein